MNLIERDGAGWLEGFNEWLCRCGLDINGPPGTEGTLHGRIANIPAHYVEVSVNSNGPGTISVTGIVDEIMMFGPSFRLKSTVSTAAGSKKLIVTDEITNVGGIPYDMELLYHTNIGRPFLEPGARFVAPIVEVVPRDPTAAAGIDTFDTFAAPLAGFAEQVYYFDLATGESRFDEGTLKECAWRQGAEHRFRQAAASLLCPVEEHGRRGGRLCRRVSSRPPIFRISKASNASRTACSRYPPRKHTAQLIIEIHSATAEVTAAEKEIATLQRGHERRVHRKPQPGWSPFG